MSPFSDRPAANSEAEIDYSDIPPLGEDFWANAYVRRPGDRKVQITLRLDEEAVAWFRAQGKGYQTQMNAVLRAFVQREKRRNRAAAE